MDITNNNDPRSIYKAQLNESLKSLKYQLYFLFIFLVIFLSIYYLQIENLFSSAITIWGAVALALLTIAIVLNHTLILENRLSTSFKRVFIYIVTGISGTFIALGSWSLAIEHDQSISNYQIIGLSFSLLCNILGLIFLTHYYRFFLVFTIPTLLPLFIGHFTQFDLIQRAIYLGVVCAYTTVMFYAGYMIYKSKLHFLITKIQHDQLALKNIQELNYIGHLSSALKQEKQRAENIKQELQHHNTVLEEKVRERTFDIERMNARLERSHQNLEMAHETAGIASWDWDIQNRLINTTNFTKIFGYNIKNMDEYLHQLHLFIHEGDIDHVKQEMRKHLRGLTNRYEAVYRVFHPTESWVWVHDMGRVVQRDAISRKPQRMVGIRRNINNEKKADEHLKLSASVFKKAAQGIFILDEKLNYVDANPYYLRLIGGLSEKNILGRHVFDIATNNHPDLQQVHLQILQQIMSKGEFDGEVVEKLSNGKELPLWIHVNALRDTKNKITHYIGIVTDLTERKNSEKKLSYLQNYDALTDLPNRYYFNHQLHEYLIQNQNQNHKLAVIRINLDRFRYYNDLLNHQGGDELLKQVATRLRRANSEAMLVARLNADDFAVILKIESSEHHIEAHGKKIIAAFEEPFKINEQEFILTISIGVALFPEHGRQMDSLNSHSEQALLQAKRIGGNTLRIYHDEKRLSSIARVNLESELRRAISNKELIVYYQPKIQMSTQTIIGFEALVRWNHPERGIIPPAQFIPLAEETSLISEIGKIVLEMSCAQIKIWNDLGLKNITVSVNIVPQQIQRGHLVTEIDAAIQTHAIASKQLELEITETSVMENSDNVRKVLKQLKEREIQVSLDDFGTGYSSLAYLALYPFDTIKIDRSFISKIGTSNQDAIVKAIIAMAKAMNKKVVAEGVETKEQYAFLLNESCDYIQGYLIAKPMSAELATDFLLNFNQKQYDKDTAY